MLEFLATLIGVLWAGIVLLYSAYLLSRGRYFYLVGSMIPVCQLLVFYFLMPIGVIFAGGNGYGLTYGISFSSVDILLVLSLVSLTALFYVLGFRLGFGSSRNEAYWSQATSEYVYLSLWLTFIVLAGLDLFYRLDAIISGTYFSWMRKFTVEKGSESVYLLLLGSVTPLLAALAIYFSRNSRRTMVYLFVFIFLVILEGKRTSMVLVYFSVSAVYVLHSDFQGGVRKKTFRVVLSALLLFMFMSVALDVRNDFRHGIYDALNSPAKFIFDSTINSIASKIGLVQNAGVNADLAGTALIERASVHLITFSTVMHQYISGYDLLSFSNFISDTLRAIPSVIVGEKEGYSAGNTMANHFDFRSSATGHHDPGSTVYQAMFSLMGPLGCVVLALLSGMAYGRLFRHMVVRYGDEAWVIAIGLVGILMINGNNYSVVLTNLRHLIMLIIVLEAVSYVAERYLRRRERNSSSPFSH